MKQSPTPSFVVETALLNLSRALSRSRLLRRETQRLAAQRANVSLATYMRMESGDIDKLAGIGIASFFEALCMVGYRDALLSLGDFSHDAEGAIQQEAATPRRGKKLSASSRV